MQEQTYGVGDLRTQYFSSRQRLSTTGQTVGNTILIWVFFDCFSWAKQFFFWCSLTVSRGQSNFFFGVRWLFLVGNAILICVFGHCFSCLGARFPARISAELQSCIIPSWERQAAAFHLQFAQSTGQMLGPSLLWVVAKCWAPVYCGERLNVCPSLLWVKGKCWGPACSM